MFSSFKLPQGTRILFAILRGSTDDAYAARKQNNIILSTFKAGAQRPEDYYVVFAPRRWNDPG